MMDLVSGAEVPAPFEETSGEIVVTPAMIAAGREVMRRFSSVASDNYLSREACNVYRAMERARRAERSYDPPRPYTRAELAEFSAALLAQDTRHRDPGYRSASEGEPSATCSCGIPDPAHSVQNCHIHGMWGWLDGMGRVHLTEARADPEPERDGDAGMPRRT